MKTRIRCITLLATLVLPCIYGQGDTGRITGTITDATGAVLQNAAINVKDEKTGQIRKVTANGQGVYLVTQLGPSTYTVRAEAAGMSPAEYSGVALQVGQERTLNIPMPGAGVSTEARGF